MPKKKIKYNSDGTVNDPLWLQAIGVIIVFGLLALFWFGVFTVGEKGVDKVKGALDSRNYKKDRCAEKSESASNSFAAKKIYKACMSK
jgi:hypothetical protein